MSWSLLSVTNRGLGHICGNPLSGDTICAQLLLDKLTPRRYSRAVSEGETHPHWRWAYGSRSVGFSLDPRYAPTLQPVVDIPVAVSGDWSFGVAALQRLTGRRSSSCVEPSFSLSYCCWEPR